MTGRAGSNTSPPLPLLLLLLLLSMTSCCWADVLQPVVDIISRHTGDCAVLTFSNVDISPWLRGLNRRQLSSMNFQFESPLGAGRLPDPPPDTNYYAEVLRLPCLTHVLWGNISSLIGGALRAVEQQKTVVIRREYFLLHDTAGSPPEALFEPLRDRPNVAVLSAPEDAGGAVRVTVRCLYCDGGRPRLYQAGNWTPDGGLQLQRALFFDQFADFHGHQLIVSQMKFLPYADYSDDGHGRQIPQPSIDMNSLQMMASKMNFSMKLRGPADGEWG